MKAIIHFKILGWTHYYGEYDDLEAVKLQSGTLGIMDEDPFSFCNKVSI